LYRLFISTATHSLCTLGLGAYRHISFYTLARLAGSLRSGCSFVVTAHPAAAPPSHRAGILPFYFCVTPLPPRDRSGRGTDWSSIDSRRSSLNVFFSLLLFSAQISRSPISASYSQFFFLLSTLFSDDVWPPRDDVEEPDFFLPAFFSVFRTPLLTRQSRSPRRLIP